MRTPKPWFRKQNQTWYIQIDGKQHRLGKDRAEAFAKFHQLMHIGVPTGNHTGCRRPEVCIRHIAHIEADRLIRRGDGTHPQW